MKLTNPLPQSLQKECLKAAKIFQSFVDNSNNGLDGVIPREVLQDAKGFAIFTIVKAGLVFSARAGSGIVIAKLDNGTWSAPSAIGIAGVGFGGQLGAEMTDFLVVLNSRSAIQTFMSAGSLTLGGNMSLAIGPLGRNSEAAGALNTNGKIAAMYSYSRSRGLFGGISIEGSVIVERQDANVHAYNSPVTVKLLLGGLVEPPAWATPLIKTLESCTGLPGHRQWINDERNRSPGGSYVFGGVSSPGSRAKSTPFFFGRKKQDNIQFPPTSWGVETNTDSYFTDAAPHSHSRNMSWNGTSATSTSTKFEASLDSDFDRSVLSPSSSTSDRKPIQPKSIPAQYGPSNPFSSAGPSSSRFERIPSEHRRNLSLNPSFTTNHSRDDLDDIYAPPKMTKFNSPLSKPLIKPREELTRPLLPHEGVARAVTLFKFEAVEDGDLSFNKGDVIVITKMSDSTDDWWTGKVGNRQGIFPANFVEIV